MFKRVYILIARSEYDDEKNDILGVFSSLYKIKKKISELQKIEKNNEYYFIIDSYKIDEFSKKIKYYK